MLVFEERGKADYPEKNLSEWTQLTLWHRRRDLNPGHISGRRALSLLCHTLLRVQTDANLLANKRLSQQLPTFFWFCDRRSVAQQCWIRLQTSSNINCWGHARWFDMVKDLNFCFRPFNVGYILNLISNLKPSVSCGLDNISSRLLRWLDTVFQGQYLPSLSINYVAKNKVLEKLPPQLY